MKPVARRISDKHRRGRIVGTADFVLMLTIKIEPRGTPTGRAGCI